MSSLRGVIFDIDGTLVDSNDAHALAWIEALEEFGHRAEFDKIRSLIGKGGDKLLPEATGIEEEMPEGKLISKRRTKIFEERYLPSLRPFPGARDLVADLRRRGLKVVVASSAQEDELEQLLKIAGVDDLMQDTTSSSDAERSKPDPDIVKAALDNLGVRPSEALMIGDTPYDIEAAAKTGIRTIGFRSGGWSDADLGGALAIYDGPADLLTHYDDSPLASRAAADAGGGDSKQAGKKAN